MNTFFSILFYIMIRTLSIHPIIIYIFYLNKPFVYFVKNTINCKI